jgi:hypothetical protein
MKIRLPATLPSQRMTATPAHAAGHFPDSMAQTAVKEWRPGRRRLRDSPHVRLSREAVRRLPAGLASHLSRWMPPAACPGRTHSAAQQGGKTTPTRRGDLGKLVLDRRERVSSLVQAGQHST